MGYDKGRRRGKDKRDGFGEEGFDSFGGGPPADFAPHDAFRNDRGGDRFGGGGGGDRGGFGGGNRGGGGGGFGGGPDVFVHISAVERAGLEGLAEGQELEFNLIDRGGKVSAQDLQVVGDVIPVKSGGGAPGGDAGGAPRRELTGEKATGTVKFFNSMKGFGFLTRDDGQPDAFVHISAVERSGLAGINEGERFEFDLEVDRRGKYSAVNLVPVQE